MRYRMELVDKLISVRNVETDLVMGWGQVHRIRDPHNPNRLINDALTVLNRHGEPIAYTPCRDFMEAPLIDVSSYEESNGYPDFAPLDEPPEPKRVEHLLGSTLADIVDELANALLEHSRGLAAAKTSKKVNGLVMQLYDLWFVSRFGSWNAERQAYEPYFANPNPQQPRLRFPAAVQEYGMKELRKRRPSEGETTLKHLLWWPIEILDRCLLKRLQPR